MNKKIRLDTAVFLLISVAVLSAVTTYTVMNNMVNGVTESMSIFSKLKKANDLVKSNYIGEIDSEKLNNYILKGYIEGLNDPYAQYFTKEEYREYQNSAAGKFQGIGVKVSYDDSLKGLYITYVMKGSPAEKKGLKVGDVITKVSGSAIADIGTTEAYKGLLGEAGSTAKFTVLRDNKEINFEIVREAFQELSIESRMYDGIGYIRIFSFADNTPKEFDDAVKSLVAQGAESIIFDVRDNPGGSLTSVTKVLDRILPKDKLIATLRYKVNSSKTNNIETVKTSDADELKLPFRILINGETASAAELFTSTLRDYNLAKTVGETTYGKGVGQETYELPDQSHIKLTVFTYVPPSGVSYNKEGITPDKEIQFPKALENRKYILTPKEDPQLAEAITELGGVIETADTKTDNIVD